MNWLTDNKIPLGSWMESFVDWLIDVAGVFFDFLSEVLETLILTLVGAIEWMHPLAVIAVVLVGAWFLHRSIGLLVFISLALLLILNLGYWVETIQTLVL
ncbi:MAG: choline ABC transporter permease subunit, partial [Marinomonas sp.]